MDYSIERQLTVALANQPGVLAAIGAALASQQVSIEALSVLDTIEQGVVRIVTNNPALCKEVLVKQGFYVIEADVLAVSLTDKPGKLAVFCQALADAGINISYAYGSVPSAGQLTRLMMRVSNLQKACTVIAALQED
ncbi:MAG: amino acid-binding protein [Anaerolineae bacterium]|nr:amino acid-binding protein [Gloeobacterales cyanobacterium ES-bin-313]